MKRTRLALVPMFALAALAFAVSPVAAQTSASAQLINELNAKLLYLAVPITIVVEGILLYTVIRFKNADEPKPTRENRRLEITWTIATAIVLLFVGVASYGVLANPNVTQAPGSAIPNDGNHVVVYVTGNQWFWQASYPQYGNFSAPTAQTPGGPSGPQIVVPKGEPVYFKITSADVIHSFHVPKLGLKQDAMPGAVHTIRTVPYETGTYQGYCAEFCGVGHSQMYFSVKVVSQDQYQKFVQQNQKSSSGSSSGGNQSVAAPTGALEAAAPA
ncbi:MAG: cytochrome c oxidase subunit II [Salinigranum sp.]